MVTFRERGITRSRSSLFNRPTPTRVSNIISRSVVRMPTSRGRPNITMRGRPEITMRGRPEITMRGRPDTTTVVRRDAAATAGGSGLSGGTGVVPATTLLGGIGGDISTTFGGVVDQAKGFIPTAIKIVAAVVILKIVLWLIKGRR